MTDLAAYTKQFDDMKSLLEDSIKLKPLDNISKRKYFSLFQLLKLNMEENIVTPESETTATNELNTAIDEYCTNLKLDSTKREFYYLQPIEIVLRFGGIASFFILSSIYCAFPIMILAFFDEFFQRNPFNYLSVKCKKFLGYLCLLVHGISINVDGADPEKCFETACSILTFTHASNMDGFIVYCVCPIKQLVFAKKELFLIPFFSWLSLACGVTPVDRSNRQRAVKALKRSAQASTKSKNSKFCIGIAPEGTRSTTGQLQTFKKGTFYLWDDIRAPIVPLVIFGASDLYPRGSWVNNTGVVTVRFLNPIPPTAADSRDKMLRLLRRKVLETLAKCPETVGKDVSTLFWMTSSIVNFHLITLLYLTFYGLHALFVNYLNFTILGAFGFCSFVSGLITILLYIYFVYIVAL